MAFSFRSVGKGLITLWSIAIFVQIIALGEQYRDMQYGDMLRFLLFGGCLGAFIAAWLCLWKPENRYLRWLPKYSKQAFWIYFIFSVFLNFSFSLVSFLGWGPTDVMGCIYFPSMRDIIPGMLCKGHLQHIQTFTANLPGLYAVFLDLIGSRWNSNYDLRLADSPSYYVSIVSGFILTPGILIYMATNVLTLFAKSRTKEAA